MGDRGRQMGDLGTWGHRNEGHWDGEHLRYGEMGCGSGNIGRSIETRGWETRGWGKWGREDKGQRGHGGGWGHGEGAGGGHTGT